MAWIDSLFQRESLPVLEAGMGFSFQKNMVISNNIANVETPDYYRQTLPEDEFTESLVEAIDNREKYHPSQFAPDEKLDLTYQGNYPRMRMFNGKEYSVERHDENSVNLETEMLDQAKNQLKMSAMQRLYKKQTTMLLNASAKVK